MNTLVKVLVGGAVVVLIAWGSLQFWLGRNGEDLRARGGVATEDGYAFASSTDQEGCVAEGLRRAGADQGIMDRALARVFVGACLERSTPVAGFCSGVPASDDIMASATWAVRECEARGLAGESYCQNHLREVQDFCDAAGG